MAYPRWQSGRNMEKTCARRGCTSNHCWAGGVPGRTLVVPSYSGRGKLSCTPVRGYKSNTLRTEAARKGPLGYRAHHPSKRDSKSSATGPGSWGLHRDDGWPSQTLGPTHLSPHGEDLLQTCPCPATPHLVTPTFDRGALLALAPAVRGRPWLGPPLRPIAGLYFCIALLPGQML